MQTQNEGVGAVGARPVGVESGGFRECWSRKKIKKSSCRKQKRFSPLQSQNEGVLKETKLESARLRARKKS